MTPISLHYHPDSPNAHARQAHLRIFVADISDRSTDRSDKTETNPAGKKIDEQARRAFSPPVREALKSGLATALSAAGITIVPGPAQSDAILSAELLEIRYDFVQQMMPPFLGFYIGKAQFRIVLKFSDQQGDVIWQEPIDGRGEAESHFAVESMAHHAYAAAFFHALKQVQERLSSPELLAKLTSPRPHVSASGIGASAAPAPEVEIHSDVDQPTYRNSEREENLAVVVGVEKYSNDLPPAPFAERDAQTVKVHLLALGYPERNIKLLLGSQATKAKLEGVLKAWLPRKTDEHSRVFFYFSGHGAPDPASNQAYLVPWDGDPSLLNDTAYPLKKLYRNLGGLKAKQVVVALDSCFSGAGARSVLSHGAKPLVTKVDASAPDDGKLVILAAAAPQEITGVLDEQGHGIFTYYLLKGLNEAGAKNRAGTVTAGGLYAYLKPKVQDAASHRNREQTPVLEGAPAEVIARFQQRKARGETDLKGQE